MKVKIELLEPIYNSNGIYYAGFVNGVYTHFLSLDKLSTTELEDKLEHKYNLDICNYFLKEEV